MPLSKVGLFGGGADWSSLRASNTLNEMGGDIPWALNSGVATLDSTRALIISNDWGVFAYPQVNLATRDGEVMTLVASANITNDVNASVFSAQVQVLKISDNKCLAIVDSVDNSGSGVLAGETGKGLYGRVIDVTGASAGSLSLGSLTQLVDGSVFHPYSIVLEDNKVVTVYTDQSFIRSSSLFVTVATVSGDVITVGSSINITTPASGQDAAEFARFGQPHAVRINNSAFFVGTDIVNDVGGASVLTHDAWGEWCSVSALDVDPKHGLIYATSSAAAVASGTNLLGINQHAYSYMGASNILALYIDLPSSTVMDVKFNLISMDDGVLSLTDIHVEASQVIKAGESAFKGQVNVPAGGGPAVAIWGWNNHFVGTGQVHETRGHSIHIQDGTTIVTGSNIVLLASNFFNDGRRLSPALFENTSYGINVGDTWFSPSGIGTNNVQAMVFKNGGV